MLFRSLLLPSSLSLSLYSSLNLLLTTPMKIDNPRVDMSEPSLIDEVQRHSGQLQNINYEPAHDEAEHQTENDNFSSLYPLQHAL